MATSAEMLTHVETAIDDLVVKGLAEVTVEGRVFKMNQLRDLIKWRDTLRGEVARSRPGGRARYFAAEEFR